MILLKMAVSGSGILIPPSLFYTGSALIFPAAEAIILRPGGVTAPIPTVPAIASQMLIHWGTSDRLVPGFDEAIPTDDGGLLLALVRAGGTGYGVRAFYECFPLNLEIGTGKRRTYSGKYALSHRVYCAHCGDVFRRTMWFLKGKNVPVWRCVSRLEKKKSGIDCPALTLFETDLHAAVVKAFNQMIEQKDEFLPGMRLAVDRALAQSNRSRVAEIDARLEALQKDLLKKANAKKGFDDLAEEIETLRSEKEALLMEDANRVGMQQRLDELEAFLEGQQEPVTDYDEGLVRKLIERITVYDGYLAFEFKCGLETEVQM